MTSNKRLLLIGASLILIYVWCDAFKPLEAFIGCLIVIGLCVWLLKKFPVVIEPFGNITSMNVQQKTYYDNELRTERNRKISIYIAGSLPALFWMRFVLGAACFSFFSFFDNTFRFSDELSPVASWLLIGSLFGATAGAFISGEKYRLSSGFKFLPALALVMIIFLFSAINKPFVTAQSLNNEVPENDVVLTPVKTAISVVKSKRKRKAKPKMKSIIIKRDSLNDVVEDTETTLVDTNTEQ